MEGSVKLSLARRANPRQKKQGTSESSFWHVPLRECGITWIVGTVSCHREKVIDGSTVASRQQWMVRRFDGHGELVVLGSLEPLEAHSAMHIFLRRHPFYDMYR